MKLNQILIYAILVLFSMPCIYGQIPIPGHSRVHNRVHSKVKREATKEGEKAIDEAIENIFRPKKETSTENTEETSTPNVTIEENDSPGDFTPNEFIGSFQMQVIQKKNGKESKNGITTISYYFDTHQTAIVPSTDGKEEMIMIFDKRDNTTTMKMINGKDKVANKMIMPNVTVDVDEEYEKNNTKVTETDEYKTIDGYKCRKYLVDSDDYSGTSWVTDEMEISYKDMMGFANVKNAKNSAPYQNFYGMTGMMLESHMTDKKESETYDVFIKNIVKGSVPSEIFDLTGYQVNDLTKFMKY